MLKIRSPESYMLSSGQVPNLTATISSAFLFEDLWEEDDDPPSPCRIRNRSCNGADSQILNRRLQAAALHLQQQSGLQAQGKKMFQTHPATTFASKQIGNRLPSQPVPSPFENGGSSINFPGPFASSEAAFLQLASFSTCEKHVSGSNGSFGTQSCTSTVSSFGTQSWKSLGVSDTSDVQQAAQSKSLPRTETIEIQSGAWKVPMSFAEVDDDDDGHVCDISDEEGDVDIVVGPLEAFGKLSTVRGFDALMNKPDIIRSNKSGLYLSDYFALKRLGGGKVLSFGSARHAIEGKEGNCRPCRFERHSGRCKRGLSCDFCHLHERRTR